MVKKMKPWRDQTNSLKPSGFTPLTHEEPQNESVSKVTTILMRDVGEAQHIKLLLARTTRRIDRPQDREGHAAANKADNGDQLEETKQQISVHGMMLQYMLVGQVIHGLDPVEQASRRPRRTLRRTQTSQVRPGHVHAPLTPTQNDEGHNHDGENDQGGNQGPDKTGGRIGILIVLEETVKKRTSCGYDRCINLYTYGTSDEMKATTANIVEGHDSGWP